MTIVDWADRPLLLAVDADAGQLGRIEGELQRAFGSDFRVRGELAPDDAVRTLQGARDRDERVAVVLVDDSFPDDARTKIFTAARILHPDARRALLVAWGAWAHHGASVSAAHALTGLRAAVVGAGNSAGQAVLHLARYCASVHLIVRGSGLAETMSSYLVDAISAQPIIQVHLNTEVIGGYGNGQLELVTIRDRTSGQKQHIPLEGLFVMIGARPFTDWLPGEVERDPHGFLSTGTDAARSGRWQLARQPHPHETTLPGLFAVGDVRCGSVKRVASAVGEGSVVVSEIHQFLAMPQA